MEHTKKKSKGKDKDSTKKCWYCGETGTLAKRENIYPKDRICQSCGTTTLPMPPIVPKAAPKKALKGAV